jgi:ribA/ribD-fused uncharacterized protein
MAIRDLNEKEHIFFYLKDNEYGWLSNFYPSPIRIRDKYYPTVEHFYQAMKTEDSAISDWIASAPKPYLALRAGQNLRDKDGFNRLEWEKDKKTIMYVGLICKFEQHPDLRTKLLNTGDAILHEDSPTDRYWGVKGQDMLGKILMEIRKVMSVKK